MAKGRGRGRASIVRVRSGIARPEEEEEKYLLVCSKNAFWRTAAI